ncbi:hypothetical protein L579_1243 [Pantoea sp. AS-PWVM4]|uniref:lipopolysaccharide biosynthesis protein n=1 Tax=Pantoea sp. AS-PWVM4 TaxID=1332069 RepID=UPI0003AC633A|nr:hypothetical protein [Pantoea sp. AS-PWVM4]ERK09460.1 hypothetical protein L579_1243 [Pantoea sp. AS-PWVM4]
MIEQIRSILKILSASFGSVVVSFLQAVLMTRLLNVDDRGIVQLFIVTTTIFSSFFISGAGNTIAFCIRNNQKKGYEKLLGLLTSILLLAIVVRLLFESNENRSILFAAQVVSLCFIQLSSELLKLQDGLRLYKVYVFVTPFSFFLITAFCYITQESITASEAIILAVSSNLVGAITGVIFIAQVMKLISINGKIERREFYKYYVKQYLMQVFGVITNNMDKYLIGKYIGITPLGLYSTAAAFNTLPLKFYNTLADYLFSGYIYKKNHDKAVILTAILGGVVGVALSFVLSKMLIVLAFGEKYLSSHEYLPFIILNLSINGLAWILSQKALISGNQLLIIGRQALGFLLFIIIFFYGTEYGLWGAIYALIAGSILRLIISIMFFIKIKV